MDSHPINDLYAFTPAIGSSTADRTNPLVEAGSLNEAELVDVRLSAQRGRAGLLFDLRGSLNYAEFNTALVILTGVASVDWSDDAGGRLGPADWRARWGDWEPTISEGIYTLRTGGNTHLLTITAARAEIYLGDVEVLGNNPIPDFTSDLVTDIIAGFPQWSSTMLVHGHYRYPEN